MSGENGTAAAAPTLPGVDLHVTLERCDNGAILTGVSGSATGAPRVRKVSITAKDLESDAAKRRVQRTIVRWVRDFFPAPARKDKGQPKAAASA